MNHQDPKQTKHALEGSRTAQAVRAPACPRGRGQAQKKGEPEHSRTIIREQRNLRHETLACLSVALALAPCPGCPETPVSRGNMHYPQLLIHILMRHKRPFPDDSESDMRYIEVNHARTPQCILAFIITMRPLLAGWSGGTAHARTEKICLEVGLPWLNRQKKPRAPPGYPRGGIHGRLSHRLDQRIRPLRRWSGSWPARKRVP